jgi:hypothetical protein
MASLGRYLGVVALTAFLSAPAVAMPIGVDEVLYDSSVSNASLLSGMIEMVLVGNQLQITLTNTSADAAGSGAGILLTGIGFQLPTGVGISGGSANMSGSTAVNFAPPAGGNASQEWGYDALPLQSGAFVGVANRTYNTSVSSMTSATTNQFQAGSMDRSPGLAGPDFGLLSASESSTLGRGNAAVRGSLYLTLALTGLPAGFDLLNHIESGNVALTFGSPDASSVPEPTSLSLLGLGLGIIGLGLRRRKRNHSQAP